MGMPSHDPGTCKRDSATSLRYSATNHTSCDADVELSRNDSSLNFLKDSKNLLILLSLNFHQQQFQRWQQAYQSCNIWMQLESNSVPIRIKRFVALRSFQCTLVDSYDIQDAFNTAEQLGVTKTAKVWTSGETDLLVVLRLENDELFKKIKIHDQIWNSIAAEMEKQGYTVSVGHCANK
ncbi:hypothetical protein CHS0354_022827 [Potamilus streckersoni]|uniref:Myb/SANT-like DNA-binding domain-containing protein n=1 Tax=Potamilus streckersoni TaxID=2493646 RepID=A0AAE0VNX0_9BIVA|nr:hypothetical protein CHS0354_022827 [Potamilus streckersoni]